MATGMAGQQIRVTQKAVATQAEKATVAFLQGEIDEIAFASAPESLILQMLLQTPGIKLTNFLQSDAYSRRFDFLSATLCHVASLICGQHPPDDVRLVGTTTALVSRSSTHPALLQLFALAGNAIHGGACWFKRARAYPNIENNELPVAKEAESAINKRPPLLQRYISFSMASLVERIWLVMGIIITVMLRLSRVLPPLYTFRVRLRIFKGYAQLRDIEQRIDTEARDTLLQKLQALERRAEKATVPLSYTDEVYALRSNIALIRQKLQRHKARIVQTATAFKNGWRFDWLDHQQTRCCSWQ